MTESQIFLFDYDVSGFNESAKVNQQDNYNSLFYIRNRVEDGGTQGE